MDITTLLVKALEAATDEEKARLQEALGLDDDAVTHCARRARPRVPARSVSP